MIAEDYSSDSDNDPDFDPTLLQNDAHILSEEDSDVATDSDDYSDQDDTANIRKCKKRKKYYRINQPPKDKKSKSDNESIWETFKNSCDALNTQKSVMNQEEIEEKPKSKPVSDPNSDNTDIDTLNPNSPSASSCSSLSSVSLNQLTPGNENSKINIPDNGFSISLRPKVLGLAGVIKLLEKKHKFNVLDRSKIEWDKFKTKEGISEQLGAYNKGRNGYLDKQEFLSRTDFRRFEIEKKLRNSARRSKL